MTFVKYQTWKVFSNRQNSDYGTVLVGWLQRNVLLSVHFIIIIRLYHCFFVINGRIMFRLKAAVEFQRPDIFEAQGDNVTIIPLNPPPSFFKCMHHFTPFFLNLKLLLNSWDCSRCGWTYACLFSKIDTFCFFHFRIKSMVYFHCVIFWFTF